MKAVIICDDPSLFLRANAALLRVGRPSEVNAQWTIKSWRANAFSQARFQGKHVASIAARLKQ